MELQAYAKLNITLDVLERRPDGYHELRSLMLAVSLSDVLWAEPMDRADVTFSGPGSAALVPEESTVAKAISVYSQLAGRPLGARIHVHKRIPAEAGLGGGSADGAAALRAMQGLYGALSEKDLFEAALRVGADVPFCLRGGLCEARGVGERLRPLALGAELYFVIAKPQAGVSTGDLFGALPLPVAHPDTEGAAAALAAGDAIALAPLLQNALEPAAADCCPDISQIKGRLLEAGALGASMTGSGSALFGLFKDEAAANRAAEALSDLPFVRAVKSLA